MNKRHFLKTCVGIAAISPVVLASDSAKRETVVPKPRFRITVLKKMANPDLAQMYCQNEVAACPCPLFQEGQVFLVGDEKPAGFCEWAWNDINKYVVVFRSGGNMGDAFHWMKSNDNVIACCTDGIRPVVFKIEKV